MTEKAIISSLDVTRLNKEDALNIFKIKKRKKEIKTVRKCYELKDYYLESMCVEYFDTDTSLNKVKIYFSKNFDIGYTEVKVNRYKPEDIYEYEGRRTTQGEILKILQLDYYREKIKKFTESHKGKYCLIKTYCGYWHESKCGYTNFAEAGIFQIEEGLSIVGGLGLEQAPELIIIN